MAENKSEVGDGKRSVAESPTGNPSPAPSAIAPHARHARSMARNRLVARPKVGGFGFSPPIETNQFKVAGEFWGFFSSFCTVKTMVSFRTCIRYVRVTLYK